MAAHYDVFMAETFVSEPIVPEAGTFDTSQMASGLAGLPAAFTWRGRRYAITECLQHTKITSTEGARAQNDRYLRRQEFLVRLDTGARARIYVERQSRPGASREAAKRRWYLYTIEREAEPESPKRRSP